MKFVSIWTCAPRMAAAMPTQAEMERMGALIGEMQQAGVLLDTGGVMNGGTSFRVRREDENVTVTDGPFTEAKEVVGGYAVLNVASKDEAEQWTRRFIACAGNGTAELHEIAEF
jgi:hypothetical protein